MTKIKSSNIETGAITSDKLHTTLDLPSGVTIDGATVASTTDVSNVGSSLATVATSGDYDDLTNKPNLTDFAEPIRLKNYTTTERNALTGLQAGDTVYNATTGSIEFYDGTNWISTNLIPAVDSVTGTIYVGVSSSLTVVATNATDTVTVRFSEGVSTIADVADVDMSSGSASVAVPAAVYGQTAGDTINVSILNQDGTPSSNAISKTVVGLPTGGTITTSGSYRIHTFTSSANLVYPSGFSRETEVLVVAGGGGGGRHSGGGGGAGGLLYYGSETPKTPNGSAISIPSGTHTVVVGAGAGNTPGSYPGGISSRPGSNTDGNGAPGYDGNNSQLAISGGSTLTAIGGGGGGYYDSAGYAGGSSGGSSRTRGASGSATSGQGNAGGNGGYNGSPYPGAGGGGAGGAGQNNNAGQQDGGPGLQYSISGTATYYAGGGGGNTQYVGVNSFNDAGAGGLGGGGRGAYGQPSEGGSYTATSGAANTGGGGGGEQYDTNNALNFGGSGIVIVRYQL